MNVINKYKEELNKIQFLKSVKKRKFRFSNILLFREYQTRLFAWKTALNIDDLGAFNKTKSFHNLFIDLAPEWLNELISEKKVIEDLNELGFDLSYTFRNYDGFFLSMFLNWEIFKDKPELQIYTNLLSPYEPVFKILSRGGTIFNIDHLFEIDGRELYRKHDNDFKLPSLSEDFLTYIDENVSDFPNKALVFELWEKFNINSRLL